MDDDFKIIDSLRRTVDPSKIPATVPQDTYRRNGPAERENGDRHPQRTIDHGASSGSASQSKTSEGAASSESIRFDVGHFVGSIFPRDTFPRTKACRELHQ